MSTLQFWLRHENEVLQLPVNPTSLELDMSSGYTDIDVTQLGEFTVMGKPKLTGFSFESFFPKFYNSAYCEYAGIPIPWNAVDKIKEWMVSDKPTRFTVTGTTINMLVTIRSFKPGEHGGEPGDVYYSMELKEYKPVSIRTIVTTSTTAAVDTTPPRPVTQPQPKTYKIVPGDCLWNIAASQLGNGSRWTEIYDMNKSTIGSNPNLIYPGTVLVMPS